MSKAARNFLRSAAALALAAALFAPGFLAAAEQLPRLSVIGVAPRGWRTGLTFFHTLCPHPAAGPKPRLTRLLLSPMRSGLPAGRHIWAIRTKQRSRTSRRPRHDAAAIPRRIPGDAVAQLDSLEADIAAATAVRDRLRSVVDHLRAGRDLAPHDLDIMRYLVGSEPITEAVTEP